MKSEITVNPPVAHPEFIRDTAHLDSLLSEPTPGVIDTLSRYPGDVIVLGAAGKMGPSLTQMIVRASEASGTKRKITAVSRFSSASAEDDFRKMGAETIKCDLLNETELNALPDAPNVIFMAGMKFGSTGNESLTWAMNSWLPGMVCKKYSKSRIAAFGTGNVYPLSSLHQGGSIETDATGPIGEYAMSCLGRERLFEHFSRTLEIPLSILRLNYAVAVRYGVLVDVAVKVWNEIPIPLAMGVANVIWQGDANAMAIQSLGTAASPPCILNLAGPEQLSIRRVAEQFGILMDKNPLFEGEEAYSALLSNGQKAIGLFGYPRVSVSTMLQWIAHWVERGGESLGKPTHFETRDGKF